ncbi:Modification methylase HaeIII [Oligella ureolytica]|nr:Modification methylase HaeIII [Oligella ureolytica]
MAGFKVISAIEIDSKAADTYRLNHPEVSIVEKDIRMVDADEFMSELGVIKGEVDLIAGCPPCQGFSKIGRKNKAIDSQDERNELIDDFARIVFALQPKTIMMENVPGLADYKKFHQFKKSLHNHGYKFRTEVLNVADYGVPQRRHRLILLASKNKKPSLANIITDNKTVRDSIFGLKQVGSSGDALHDFPEKRTEKVMKIIKLIPKDGGSRSSLPVSLQLACHQRSAGFNDVYGRMAWDEPSPTITGGCTNPSKGRFLHPEEDRAITMREAAILQSFPIDYQFNIKHGKGAISQMIGNALPPIFIKVHAQSLIKCL